MTDTDKNITLLIMAQLNGTASENELNELKQWLESDPSNKRKYTELKTIMRSKPIKHTKQETEMAYSKIEKVINETTNKSRLKPEKIKSFSPVRIAIGIAASIILAFVIYQTVDKGWKDQDSMVIMTKNCAKGEKLHLTLSDGSEVWLNADSRITFPDVLKKRKKCNP